MPTFAQIRTKVSKKLIDPNNTAISAADVGDAINDAIAYWKHKTFWFNQSTGTTRLDSSAGTSGGLEMPEDFLYEDLNSGFVIYDAGNRYILQKKTNFDFDVHAQGDVTGVPSIYTYRYGAYEIAPAPDQDYVLTIYYTQDYDPLVADSDTNDFTEYADQLITYEALGRLSGEDRQDLEMNNTYMAKADREYRSLMSRTAMQTATGTLSIDFL